MCQVQMLLVCSSKMEVAKCQTCDLQQLHVNRCDVQPRLTLMQQLDILMCQVSGAYAVGQPA